MRIDVHAHRGPQDDLAARVATLDGHGVQLQLRSAFGPDPEPADADASARAARLVNDAHADAAARYPGRFAVLAAVGLPHVEQAIAETDRAFGELDAVGVALPCSAGGRTLDHPDLEPFWANLAGHDALVLVHPPGACTAGPALPQRDATQMDIAPLRVLLSGLSVRHPTLRFVFALAGGLLPHLHPRVQRHLSTGVPVGAVPEDPADPLRGLRDFWYDVAALQPLAGARDTFGVDRLVLGSGGTTGSLGRAIDHVQRSASLSWAEKDAVVDRNAERALGPELLGRLTVSRV